MRGSVYAAGMPKSCCIGFGSHGNAGASEWHSCELRMKRTWLVKGVGSCSKTETAPFQLGRLIAGRDSSLVIVKNGMIVLSRSPLYGCADVT